MGEDWGGLIFNTLLQKKSEKKTIAASDSGRRREEQEKLKRSPVKKAAGPFFFLFISVGRCTATNHRLLSLFSAGGAENYEATEGNKKPDEKKKYISNPSTTNPGFKPETTRVKSDQT